MFQIPNPRRISVFFLLSVALGAAAGSSARGETKQQPGVREFQFNYHAAVVDLPAGAKVRIWIPVPQDSDHQQIERQVIEGPGRLVINREPVYGNRIGYFQTVAPASGEVKVSAAYVVTRREVRGWDQQGPRRLTPQQQRRGLAGSTRVPLDGKPAALIADVAFPDDEVGVARTLYDLVERHMKYDKSRPGYGTGDAVWACDSRFGNCTDFHSLFMSLARMKGVAADFEIGFPLPAERGSGDIGGYHCWAHFFSPGRGWVPVDISEADKHPEKKQYFFGNLDENRVAFTRGRDLTLLPQAAAGPLNYFIYPHVEVAGAAWPKQKIQLQFRYVDRS